MKTVNLAKALCKNKNCWGFIFKSDSGRYLYQNDNDLGLDLEGLNNKAPYIKKIYIVGRYYAYLMKDQGGEDDAATDLKTAKALLHECHDHVVELTPREKKLVYNYWMQFAGPR